MTESQLTERERMVYLAKLAEQAERYDEMAEFMQKVAKCATEELTVEERNLLSVAFKNSVGARRASLRIVASVEQKQKKRKTDGEDKQDVNQIYSQLATKYRSDVEHELDDICGKLLSLVDEHLLTIEDSSSESQVFYCKMKGDYFRYLAEFSPSEKKNEIDSARKSYEEATAIATKELSPTHPIRLGLALNFSVFYFEILANSVKACQMAQNAFDEAIKALDQCIEEHYRDSTLIMQLLRDNLTLWQSDVGNSESKFPGEDAQKD
eukprot:GHVH01012081.1.p1 GENE.GHVH01012081.1~~GHVH01012081.1.p1  ORF type:complete len:266 (+),score=45.16 GHVH01012081.1:139-936(+)